MVGQITLEEHLDRYLSIGSDALTAAVTATLAIAGAAIEIADLVNAGAVGSAGGTSDRNSDGDLQHELDVKADAILRRCLLAVPVAAMASEEANEIEIADGKICVAFDPLDGSSNIHTNLTIGTIFSIMPATEDLNQAFFQRGSTQIAAGFVTYGPQTSLVLTLGDGVDVFTLDRTTNKFRLVRSNVRIPERGSEFSINMSNRRHWEPPVRVYIDECLAGIDGAATRDFNMRWVGSLVAEAFRILTRGGIFLYPSDTRPTYGEGRLRLVYEAHPIAFIIEQAGGAASTGLERILDLTARNLHQRVPLIMGSRHEVDRLDDLHRDPKLMATVSAPLFSRRGFFRH